MLPFSFVMKKANHSTALRITVLISTFLFVLLLVWAIYLKFGRAYSIEFNHYRLHEYSAKERFLLDIIPFEIGDHHTNPKMAVVEIFLNGLVMAPFGVLFNIIDKRPRVLKHLLIVFLISLTFEIVQFCTLIGGFATADLIMNTLGYFIGYGIYHLIFKRLPDKANLIIFAIVNVLFIGILIYAVTTIIVIWDLLVKILTTNHFKLLPLK